MAEVTMTKVSAHKRGQSGRQGVCMYTLVTGTGKAKRSITKHLTEAGAEAFKSELAGK